MLWSLCHQTDIIWYLWSFINNSLGLDCWSLEVVGPEFHLCIMLFVLWGSKKNNFDPWTLGLWAIRWLQSIWKICQSVWIICQRIGVETKKNLWNHRSLRTHRVGAVSRRQMLNMKANFTPKTLGHLRKGEGKGEQFLLKFQSLKKLRAVETLRDKHITPSNQVELNSTRNPTRNRQKTREKQQKHQKPISKKPWHEQSSFFS